MNDKVINMSNTMRPEKFSDMVGQPYIKGVGKRLGQGKVSGQGYILSGPRGTGKTTTARIIAKSLNCLNRNKDNGDPCGECKNCELFEDGLYPYTKEINAASNRGIGDVKESLSTINDIVPYGYRVYIFDEFQMLTREAFSSMLKVIEEPPENVIFIFTTTNPEKIPDTILSRSPIINVLPLKDDEIRDVLDRVIEEGKKEDPESWGKVTEDDIYQAIISATGSARQAITNLSGIVFHGVQGGPLKDHTEDIIQLFLSGSVAGVLSQSSAALSEEGADPVILIGSIINGMVDKISSGEIDNNVEIHAKQVSLLAQISQDISSSSPSSIVSASIASCVIGDDISDYAPKKELSSIKKGSASKKNDNPVENGSDLNSNKKSKDNDMFYVHPDTEEKDIFYHLLDSHASKKYINDKWREVLDDPRKSDITQDVYTGEPVIAVKNPDEDLRQALHHMFSHHTLKKK